MSRVHGVLNYAGCFAKAAGSVDGVNGWEAGLHDGTGLRSHTTLCSFLRSWSEQEPIPSCDTSGKDAFYVVSVKVGESRS